MATVLLYTPKGFRGAITQAPSGSVYYAQPNMTIEANTLDLDLLYSYGYTLAPQPPLSQTSRSVYLYRSDTHITSGPPAIGQMFWNDATEIAATVLGFSHITDDGVDIDQFLALITTGNSILVQDRNNSVNFQTWSVTGSVTIHTESYVTVPVSFTTSGGIGTSNFQNNHQLFAAVFG